jgi:sulfotransferase family protein
MNAAAMTSRPAAWAARISRSTSEVAVEHDTVAGYTGAAMAAKRTSDPDAPLWHPIASGASSTVTLPSFLVIGAQRGGTTLLHRILDSHPEVYVPYRRKEIHFFDWYFDRGIQWYSKFFPPSHEALRYRAIGEATPDYMFDPRVPGRIHATRPDCRFVLSLRNPIARAFSWYRFCLRSVNEQRPPDQFFLQEKQCLQRGRYSEQLARYFALFPRDAFLILIYEELVADPRPQLEALANFLRLSRGWPDPSSLVQQQFNASEIPRFRAAFARAQRFGEFLTRNDLDWIVRLARQARIPQMFGKRTSTPQLSDRTQRTLAEYYADEVVTLEKMLGRRLDLWTLS